MRIEPLTSAVRSRMMVQKPPLSGRQHERNPRTAYEQAPLNDPSEIPLWDVLAARVGDQIAYSASRDSDDDTVSFACTARENTYIANTS